MQKHTTITADIPDELYQKYLEHAIKKHGLKSLGMNRISGIREINSKMFIEKIREELKSEK